MSNTNLPTVRRSARKPLGLNIKLSEPGIVPPADLMPPAQDGDLFLSKNSQGINEVGLKMPDGRLVTTSSMPLEE